ncbi:hypothetical protein DPEC_G00138060 [Dallia pectoralis]|uniref:Uncharacterized protein n=1 Tax=Dallia pectoralis TaxID=75939 RepID=A0ACC2GLR5_DALPE|nr:hypothetical protein DPEC_G00138060 [Dallia pectoralis]
MIERGHDETETISHGTILVRQISAGEKLHSVFVSSKEFARLCEGDTQRDACLGAEIFPGFFHEVEVLITSAALIGRCLCLGLRRLSNINPHPRLQMHLKEGDKRDISRTS